MKEKAFILFGILSFLFFFFLILYFKQAEFASVYDPQYWKDRFEHSQWVLPLSRRDMGDDGIYAYAGYRMMQGASVEETNANKPPVGLYLIGISISFFKNQNILIFIIGILSLFVFYLINLHFIKNKILSFFTTILLAINPMFFSHMWVSLLDLIQTFFLLCHVLMFIYCLKYNKYSVILALFAGLFLGFFTETKPPILLILIMFLEVGCLIYLRKIKEIVSIGLGFSIGILLPYYQYFLNGHNLIDFLRLHKYMASIYYEGQNEIHRLALFQAILLGKFPDVSNGKIIPFQDWWFTLPLIWIGALVSIFNKLKDKKADVIIKGLGILIIVAFLFFSNVSSYPRYLLIVFPFVVVFFTLFVQKMFAVFRTIIILSVIILFGLANMFYYLQPKPDSVLSRFYHNISSGLFQDVYRENIANSKNTGITEEEFRKILLLAYHQANIVSLDFKERNRVILGNRATIAVDVTYLTRDIGSFNEEKNIYLQKNKEKWEIIWDWNYIVNGYEPGFTFVREIFPGKRGAVYDSVGNIIVYDSEGYLISIDPSKIDKSREEKMLKALEKLTKINSAAIHNNYVENPVEGIIYSIGTNFYKWSEKDLENLRIFPEIIITPHIVRIYDSLNSSAVLRNIVYYDCCSKIYSPYSFHAIQGIEMEKDAVLSGRNGGILLMKDKNEKTVRTLINSIPKNGEDIIIPI